MTEFKWPSWSARNPLGIVALFISLIYGMSALLLGASIGSLTSQNQTILVLFIAIFPFVVLFVFTWLVTRHHTKLYGPGDYRSDRGFIEAQATAVGKRLQAELAEADLEARDASGSKRPPAETIQLHPGRGKSAVLTRAYTVEGLLFQALQTEFGGAVRRNIRLPNGVELDGVVELPDGRNVIVEVKFIAGDSTTFGKRIRHAYAALAAIQEKSWNAFPRPTTYLLAFIVDGNPTHVETVRREAETQKVRNGIKVDLRVYSLEEMLREHGFPVERTGG